MSFRLNTPLRELTRHTAAALGAIVILATLAIPASGASSTYYVDCSAGNDSASGQSTSLAWRSLSKANAASLVAGDSLLFKRGCAWTGPLNARWQGTSSAPITIGAYGSGALPRIENASGAQISVTGKYMVFDSLLTRSNPPGYDSGCQNQPQGAIYGWRFMSGSSFNTVRNSEARNLNIGVWLGPGSSNNKIFNNVLADNNVKDSDPNSDGGAVAVGVHGDDNEIAYNQISGSDASVECR